MPFERWKNSRESILFRFDLTIYINAPASSLANVVRCQRRSLRFSFDLLRVHVSQSFALPDSLNNSEQSLNRVHKTKFVNLSSKVILWINDATLLSRSKRIEIAECCQCALISCPQGRVLLFRFSTCCDAYLYCLAVLKSGHDRLHFRNFLLFLNNVLFIWLERSWCFLTAREVRRANWLQNYYSRILFVRISVLSLISTLWLQTMRTVILTV